MSGSKASWAALVYAAIATGTMVLNAAAPSAASQPPPPVIRHYPPHPAAFLLYFVRDIRYYLADSTGRIVLCAA